MDWGLKNIGFFVREILIANRILKFYLRNTGCNHKKHGYTGQRLNLVTSRPQTDPQQLCALNNQLKDYIDLYGDLLFVVIALKILFGVR